MMPKTYSPSATKRSIQRIFAPKITPSHERSGIILPVALSALLAPGAASAINNTLAAQLEQPHHAAQSTISHTTSRVSGTTLGDSAQVDRLWRQILSMNIAADPQGVIDACLELILIDKTFYGPHYYMGIAAQQSGQTSLAQSAFDKALRLISEALAKQPDRTELLATKADLYQRTGKARAAVTVREKLLRLTTDFEAQVQHLMVLLELFKDPKLQHLREQYLRVSRYRYPAAFEDCRIQAAVDAMLAGKTASTLHCTADKTRQTGRIANTRPQSNTVTSPQTANSGVYNKNQPQAQLASLTAQFTHRPDAETAWQVAKIFSRQEKKNAADIWFNKALQTSATPSQILNWLSQLQNEGNISFLRRCSKTLLQLENFTKRQLLSLNQIIIKAEQRAGNKQYQLEAWMRFFRISQDSNALLNVVRLHNDLNQHSQALKIINRVQLDFLPSTDKAFWYDEMGETYFQRQQLNNARYVRQQAVQLQPTGERWFNLAVTLYGIKDLPAAAYAIDQALASEPENSRYLVRKAQIANATNDAVTARAILDQIARTEPDDYEINANIAVTSSAIGDSQDASRSWRRALASLDRETVVGKKPADLTRLSVRSHLRSLENSWFFNIHSAACLSDADCYRFANAATPGSDYSRAAIRVDYAMNKHWRLNAAIEVSNDHHSLRPDDSSLLAAAGFSYLPFEQQNLVISINRLFARDSQSTDNTRIALQWNNMPRGRKENLPAGRISSAYNYFSAEVSRLLEHNQDTFAAIEGRKGRQISKGDKSLFIPYIFGQGRYLNNKVTEYSALESGIGLSYQLLHSVNENSGEQAQTELFLKAGRDLVVEDDEEEFRAVIGVDFNY